MACFLLSLVMNVPKESLEYLYAWGPWVFNLILAIVGVLQVWLLTVTWKAIAKQAELQKFAAQQWIEVSGWDVSKDENLEDSNGRLKESTDLYISFSIMNRSQVPLTLDKVVCEISTTIKEPHWQRYEGSRNGVIAPRSDGDDSYSCSFSVLLQGDDLYRYSRTALGISLRLEISFMDAEGKPATQVFRRLLACGPKKFAITKDTDDTLRKFIPEGMNR